jgi:hypothetical protein
MHEKHLQFWGKAELQQFWSGRSFLRSDDGNMLSYDLARILVAQFSSEWEVFRSFVLEASLSDAGALAARQHLGLELGTAVAAVLEKVSDQGCHPNPESWDAPPETGAFRGNASEPRKEPEGAALADPKAAGLSVRSSLGWNIS